MANVSSKTKTLAVIGDPISHSLSPTIHNSALQHLNLDYCYLAFHVRPQELSKAVTGINALNIKGINVTSPHKENIIPFLDIVSPIALEVGAVNTVKNDQGKLAGYNTDGQGFVVSLMRRFPQINLKRTKFLILGVGGSARAIAYELTRQKAQSILIANRTLKKATELAQDISAKYPLECRSIELENTSLDKALQESDIIINTLPTNPDDKQGKCFFNPNLFSPEKIVIDLKYSPPLTKFLSLAKEKGCQVQNGLSMLVEQGILAFEIFTGEKAPSDIMFQSVDLLVKAHD